MCGTEPAVTGQVLLTRLQEYSWPRICRFPWLIFSYSFLPLFLQIHILPDISHHSQVVSATVTHGNKYPSPESYTAQAFHAY